MGKGIDVRSSHAIPETQSIMETNSDFSDSDLDDDDDMSMKSVPLSTSANSTKHTSDIEPFKKQDSDDKKDKVIP
jgi:hypothetical protein